MEACPVAVVRIEAVCTLVAGGYQPAGGVAADAVNHSDVVLRCVGAQHGIWRGGVYQRYSVVEHGPQVAAAVGVESEHGVVAYATLFTRDMPQQFSAVRYQVDAASDCTYQNVAFRCAAGPVDSVALKVVVSFGYKRGRSKVIRYFVKSVGGCYEYIAGNSYYIAFQLVAWYDAFPS